MRTRAGKIVASTFSAAVLSGCVAIIASDTGYHDEEYDDCDRCHQTVVVIETAATGDTLFHRDTTAPEAASGS